MSKETKIKYLDFFAGIGGFHSAFSRVGWECLGFCEIDRFARQSYKAIHNTEGIEEWHDITRVSNDDFRRLRGRVDVIAGGFPCQAFSVAGKRGGFEDTRGTLFFEVARAAQQIQPRYLLLENVKGLLNHDKGNTFGTILNTLHELGYAHIEWGIFNTKYWGVPQNRERVFILAELRDEPTAPYLLPLLQQQHENGVTARLRDVLETNVDEKYYLSEEKTAKLIETLEDRVWGKGATEQGYDSKILDTKSHDNIRLYNQICPTIMANDFKEPKKVIEKTQVVANLNHYGNDQMNRVYGVGGQAPAIVAVSGGGREPKIAEPQEFTDGSGISYCIDASYAKGTSAGNVGKGRRTHAIEVRATLTPDRAEKRQQGRRFKDNDEPAFTINTQDRHGVLIANPPEYRIRKLTPLECWRLQDFTDEQFKKARADGVSNSQLYKQAGNSVTVKVVEMIARKIENRIKEELLTSE